MLSICKLSTLYLLFVHTINHKLLHPLKFSSPRHHGLLLFFNSIVSNPATHSPISQLPLDRFPSKLNPHLCQHKGQSFDIRTLSELWLLRGYCFRFTVMWQLINDGCLTSLFLPYLSSQACLVSLVCHILHVQYMQSSSLYSPLWLSQGNFFLL